MVVFGGDKRTDRKQIIKSEYLIGSMKMRSNYKGRSQKHVYIYLNDALKYTTLDNNQYSVVVSE